MGTAAEGERPDSLLQVGGDRRVKWWESRRVGRKEGRREGGKAERRKETKKNPTLF